MSNTAKILSTFFYFWLICVNISCSHAGKSVEDFSDRVKSDRIVVAAERINEYVPLLRNKTIAIVANQTSQLGQKHLVDSLISLGSKIKCVFAPEHGFRGEAGAGDKIPDGIDRKTGLPIISLYGKHLKPTREDLRNVDIVLFDIQDVGARFYTYISTLQYVMESCAENNVELIVLDRPNPNGYYVDGPVLEDNFKSFVGMCNIPVVHGMTIGEYAKMLKGEKWFMQSDSLKLKVVLIENYTHDSLYKLPIRPSPNLPNMESVYLYPSLCFFEGTSISLGRGTPFPFQCIGFPGLKNGTISFTPVNIKGVVSNPPYRDTLCQGLDLRSSVFHEGELDGKIQIHLLLDMYDSFPAKHKFFNSFFEKLAGTGKLREQIINRTSEADIRKSWEPELSAFKKIRKKYLLYPDFTE